jgi:hypothetical protein
LSEECEEMKVKENDHVFFLCVCDVLVADRNSVTRPELAGWSAYILQTPIRDLYLEGRKFNPTHNLQETVDQLDIDKISDYLQRERSRGAHEAIETVGKHIGSIADNPKVGEVIIQLVNLAIKK